MSQPLYLFADSQPLFWRSGAFGIFAAAFAQIDTRRTHWVRADYSAADRDFLETADVIVLAVGRAVEEFVLTAGRLRRSVLLAQLQTAQEVLS